MIPEGQDMSYTPHRDALQRWINTGSSSGNPYRPHHDEHGRLIGAQARRAGTPYPRNSEMHTLLTRMAEGDVMACRELNTKHGKRFDEAACAARGGAMRYADAVYSGGFSSGTPELDALKSWISKQ
jgi:hypothetical protein